MAANDLIRRQRGLVATAFGLLLAACVTGGEIAGEPCLDDSGGCVDRRIAVLDAMVADPQRHWVNEPASRQMHASGIRLFAYQATKDKMSCQELSAGLREMKEVKLALGSGPAPGMSAERGNLVKAMADDVAEQLHKTRKAKHCGKA